MARPTDRIRTRGNPLKIPEIVEVQSMLPFEDGPNVDAFARFRTSHPYTMFDSKQVFHNQPLLWDDAETSGSGTASTHSTDEAASTMSVGATTAGTRVRQTFRRFNYQPGKSQLIFMTFAEMSTGTGITKRAGYFDDNNGLFFQSSGGVQSFVRRTHITGSPVDNVFVQNEWNLDKLDGGGPSGLTLNPEKAQILIIDFEWLGVGRVRFGFVVDGKIVYCHQDLAANVLSSVYMSNPVLPLRYEISNDGTGAADDFVVICSTVISEGGSSFTGIARHAHNLNVSSLATSNEYALMGIRLQSGSLGDVEVVKIGIASATAGDTGHWMLLKDPTVAGTFNYTNQTNSIVQTANGSSANTVTGGTQIEGGFVSTSAPGLISLPDAARLGALINGTPQTLVLTFVPLTNNITVSANIEWVERS